MSTLAAVLTEEPEPGGRVVPGLSADLEKLIARCLRKNPERRWQSMADLKVALEDLQQEADSASPAESAASARARGRLYAVVAAVALFAIGAAIAGVWWQTFAPRRPPLQNRF